MRVKDMMPKFVHLWYMICQTFGYDVKRYLKYAFAYSNHLENKKAALMMVLHTLEKGLTMPNVHLGFGQDKIAQISQLVCIIGKTEIACFEMKYALSLIQEYEAFHIKNNYTLPLNVIKYIKDIKSVFPSDYQSEQSVQLHFSASQFFEQDGDISTFLKSRHSIRNYIDRPISPSIFKEVATIANLAPSSCNRQCCRMHVATNRKHVEEILAIQGGCRGFGHLAPAVIIVTSDLRCFYDVQERAQPAINSGFFGMNILYALHDKHIGACVLNWSYTQKEDLKIRKIIPSITDSEQIEFLISCGYPPTEFDVALSKRKSTESCICFVDEKG